MLELTTPVFWWSIPPNWRRCSDLTLLLNISTLNFVVWSVKIVKRINRSCVPRMKPHSFAEIVCLNERWKRRGKPLPPPIYWVVCNEESSFQKVRNISSMLQVEIVMEWGRASLLGQWCLSHRPTFLGMLLRHLEVWIKFHHRLASRLFYFQQHHILTRIFHINCC